MKSRFLSLGVTFLVLFIVFFASTASAIKLNLKTDKQVYGNDSRYVVFTTSIDINKDEKVPITGLKLIINKDYKVCTFGADGSSSSCPNVYIRPLYIVPRVKDNLNGKGFGSVDGEKPTDKKTDFGFGYGYGEEPHRQGLNGEMLYEIKWDIKSDNVSNGKYEAFLEATAENGNKSFIYRTTGPTVFQVKLLPNQKGQVLASTFFDVYDGDIVKLNTYTTFAKEDPYSLSVDIRKVLDEGKTFVEGKVNAVAYAELSNGTKMTLDVDFEDYKIVKFDSDGIELTGHVKYAFTANDLKGKQIANKKGEEIATFVIDTDAATARISSTDKVPFDVIYDADAIIG